jgi:hypothetical protein
MNVMHTVVVSLVMGLSASAAQAYSPRSSHVLADNGGCHLMTESECRVHLGKLGELPAGEEREAYLAAHKALILERGALCGSALSRNTLLKRAAYR